MPGWSGRGPSPIKTWYHNAVTSSRGSCRKPGALPWILPLTHHGIPKGSARETVVPRAELMAQVRSQPDDLATAPDRSFRGLGGVVGRLGIPGADDASSRRIQPLIRPFRPDPVRGVPPAPARGEGILVADRLEWVGVGQDSNLVTLLIRSLDHFFLVCWLSVPIPPLLEKHHLGPCTCTTGSENPLRLIASLTFTHGTGLPKSGSPSCAPCAVPMEIKFSILCNLRQQLAMTP